MKRLQVRTDSPDDLVTRLPDVMLTGSVVEREPDGHGWVQIEPALPEDVPESLWFELSWHADKLGISQGREVDLPDPEPADDLGPEDRLFEIAEPILCPECRNSKEGNCIGQTLDAADNWVPCATTNGEKP